MISFLAEPLFAAPLHVDAVRGSELIRVITMCHRAALAWRSPPRLSRSRVTLPEEASMGLTPHRWAQAASERNRSGLSPAATSKAAALSLPTPYSDNSPGAVSARKRARSLSSSLRSASRARARRPRVRRAVLVAKMTGSPSGSGPHGRRLLGDQPTRNSLQGLADFLWGGETEMADLVHGLDLGGPRRAFRHHQRPDRFHVAVPGLGRAQLTLGLRGAGRFDGVDSVGLALTPALLAVRAVHLDHLDPARAQKPGQAPHTSRCLPPRPWHRPEPVIHSSSCSLPSTVVANCSTPSRPPMPSSAAATFRSR